MRVQHFMATFIAGDFILLQLIFEIQIQELKDYSSCSNQ